MHPTPLNCARAAADYHAALMSQHAAPSSPQRRILGRWAGALALIAATFCSYLPSLNGGFVWDDEAWTTNIEPLLRDAHGLMRMWTSPTALQQFFPLTGTTFWIDHHLWGGWTLPYHVENIALHTLSALLFWRLLTRLGVPGAWLAAALFALHPVMAESVAWITERKSLLSMVLFLCALLAYGRFTSFWRDGAPRGRRCFYWLALLLFTAALLAKATAFSFPAVVLLIAWWRRGAISWRRDVLPALPFFVISIAFGLLISWIEVHHVGADGSQWPVATVQRPIIAGRAIRFYLGKLLWPAGLHPIYPRWDIDARQATEWIAPFACLGALAGLWALRGRIGRAPLAAALFFIGTLFPVLGFLNMYGMVYSFVADRWVYVSSLGVFAVSAALVARAGRAWMPPLFAAAVLPALSFLTWNKAGQYKDAQTLMRAALAGNPRCWLACYNLANDLEREGRTDEALALFEKAVAIWPGYAMAHTNYGSLLLRLGRDEEALNHLTRAIEIAPATHAAHFNLGLLRLKKNQLAEAGACFERVTELLPDFVPAHQNLGVLLLRQGDVAGAIRHYEKVAALTPDEPQAHRDVAASLLRAGRIREIIPHLERLIALDPRDLSALSNLAGILATSPDDDVRNGPRALELAQLANQLTDGKNAGTLYTLAAAYAETGNFADAIGTADAALKLAEAAGNDRLAYSIRETRKLYLKSTPLRDVSLKNSPQ